MISPHDTLSCTELLVIALFTVIYCNMFDARRRYYVDNVCWFVAYENKQNTVIIQQKATTRVYVFR